MKIYGGVWFGCFLFSFSLKTDNDDENVFGLISENIFSENENNKVCLICIFISCFHFFKTVFIFKRFEF